MEKILVIEFYFFSRFWGLGGGNSYNFWMTNKLSKIDSKISILNKSCRRPITMFMCLLLTFTKRRITNKNNSWNECLLFPNLRNKASNNKYSERLGISSNYFNQGYQQRLSKEHDKCFVLWIVYWHRIQGLWKIFKF